MDERLKKQMEFALEMDKEKGIGRQTYILNALRKENDAEHGWHLAIMTMLLSEYANEKIDIGRTIEMVVIHDGTAGKGFCWYGSGKGRGNQRRKGGKVGWPSDGRDRG